MLKFDIAGLLQQTNIHIEELEQHEQASALPA